MEGLTSEEITMAFAEYSFLRTMSVVLQLSPFTETDFFAALQSHCDDKQFGILDHRKFNLITEIHLSLFKICLSGINFDSSNSWYHIDFSLLDQFNWPMYLIPILSLFPVAMSQVVSLDADGDIICGKTEHTEFTELARHLNSNHFDYFDILTKTKIEIIQRLIEVVLNNSSIVAGLEMRAGTQSDVNEMLPLFNKGEDGCMEVCILCAQGGDLIICEKCPACFHKNCLFEQDSSVFEGDWVCYECQVADPVRSGGRLPWISTKNNCYVAVIGSNVIKKALSKDCHDAVYTVMADGDVAAMLSDEDEFDWWNWPWLTYLQSCSNVSDLLKCQEEIKAVSSEKLCCSGVDITEGLQARRGRRPKNSSALDQHDQCNEEWPSDGYINHYRNASLSPYCTTAARQLLPPSRHMQYVRVGDAVAQMERIYNILGPFAGRLWAELPVVQWPLRLSSWLARLCVCKTLTQAKHLLLELVDNILPAAFQPEWFMTPHELALDLASGQQMFQRNMGRLGQLAAPTLIQFDEDGIVSTVNDSQKNRRKPARRLPVRVPQFTSLRKQLRESIVRDRNDDSSSENSDMPAAEDTVQCQVSHAEISAIIAGDENDVATRTRSSLPLHKVDIDMNPEVDKKRAVRGDACAMAAKYCVRNGNGQFRKKISKKSHNDDLECDGDMDSRGQQQDEDEDEEEEEDEEDVVDDEAVKITPSRSHKARQSINKAKPITSAVESDDESDQGRQANVAMKQSDDGDEDNDDDEEEDCDNIAKQAARSIDDKNAKQQFRRGDEHTRFIGGRRLTPFCLRSRVPRQLLRRLARSGGLALLPAVSYQLAGASLGLQARSYDMTPWLQYHKQFALPMFCMLWQYRVQQCVCEEELTILVKYLQEGLKLTDLSSGRAADNNVMISRPVQDQNCAYLEAMISQASPSSRHDLFTKPLSLLSNAASVVEMCACARQGHHLLSAEAVSPLEEDLSSTRRVRPGDGIVKAIQSLLGKSLCNNWSTRSFEILKQCNSDDDTVLGDRLLSRRSTFDLNVGAIGIFLYEQWIVDIVQHADYDCEGVDEIATALHKYRNRVRRFADEVLQLTDQILPSDCDRERDTVQVNESCLSSVYCCNSVVLHKDNVAALQSCRQAALTELSFLQDRILQLSVHQLKKRKRSADGQYWSTETSNQSLSGNASELQRVGAVAMSRGMTELLLDRLLQAAVEHVVCSQRRMLFKHKVEMNRLSALSSKVAAVAESADCASLASRRQCPCPLPSETTMGVYDTRKLIFDLFSSSLFKQRKGCKISLPSCLEQGIFKPICILQNDSVRINRQVFLNPSLDKDIYFPQVGDEVIYYLAGHREYVAHHPDTLNMDLRKGLLKRRFDLDWMPGRILSIDYEFSGCCSGNKTARGRAVGEPAIIMIIQLGMLGQSLLPNAQKTFSLAYQPGHSCAEFLVLREVMDRALRLQWGEQSAFSMIYQGGDRFSGEVLQVQRDVAGMPVWSGVTVSWAAWGEDSLNEWELEVPESACVSASIALPGTSCSDAVTGSVQLSPQVLFTSARRQLVNDKLLEVMIKYLRLPEYQSFQDAVSDAAAADYSCCVPVCLHLHLLKQRCSNVYYRQPQALLGDVRIMCTNCAFYNLESSGIASVAADLYRALARDVILAFPEDPTIADCLVFDKCLRAQDAAVASALAASDRGHSDALSLSSSIVTKYRQLTSRASSVSNT